MKKISFVLIVFGILFVGTLGAVDVEKILGNVPEGDLDSFLRFYLQIGYELAKSNNNKEISKGNPNIRALDSLQDFAINLYEWALKNCRVQTRGRMFNPNIVCFENGVCLNIGDIGVHP